jgi:hypothetical protein
MAKIDCSLSVTSDILPGLDISSTMTLKKADSEVGIELTSGLVRRSFTSTNQVDLVTAGAQNYGTPTASKSAKVYIKNVGSDSTKHFKIGKGTSSGSAAATAMVGNATTYWELGRLYGGDWMLIPWDAATTTGDITIQPSSAEKMDVEFMVFFE